MFRSKSLVLIIVSVCLGLSGCYRVKPEPVPTSKIIDQQIEELEAALNDLDFEKLQELLAEHLILDWESINSSDLEKVAAFIGDYDEIETAVLTEISRSILEGRIIIDAELYLELIKNHEKLQETKNLSIVFENLGTKWTGDMWLITSIISYNSGEYQYQNPAADPDELLDRLAENLLNKTFYNLPDLLAFTVVATHGTTVNYYRNNQQFIALLANDMQELELSDLRLLNRHYTIQSSAIQAAADLTAAIKIDGQWVDKSVAVTFTLVEIPGGLVINRISYPPNFFGLL